MNVYINVNPDGYGDVYPSRDEALTEGWPANNLIARALLVELPDPPVPVAPGQMRYSSEEHVTYIVLHPKENEGEWEVYDTRMGRQCVRREHNIETWKLT